MERNLTELINSTAEDFFGSLFPGFWLTAAAILIFTVCASFFFFRKAGKGKHKKDHLINSVIILIILMMTFLLLVTFQIRFDASGIISYIVMILLGILSVFGFFRGRLFSEITSIAFFWAGGIGLSVQDITDVYSDYKAFDSFAESQKTVMCVISDIKLMRCLFLELIIAVITVWIIGRFRKMFLEEEQDDSTVVEKIEEKLKEKRREPLVDILKTVAAFVLVAAFLLVPEFIANPEAYLVTGSADINNRYIKCLNEYLDDGNVREDEDWKNEFIKNNSELTDLNTRPFDINIRAVRYNDLTFLSLHSDAAYQQLLASDNIFDAVNVKDQAGAETAGEYFNATNVMMMSALSESLTPEDNSLIIKFYILAVDAFRFYTSLLPLWAWAVVFTAISVLLILLGIKKGKSAPFCDGSIKEKLLSRHISLKLSKGDIATVAVTSVLCAFILISGMATSGPVPEEGSYNEATRDAFVETGAGIMQQITSASPDERLTELLDSQDSAIDGFLSIGEDDIDDGFEDIHEQLSADAVNIKETVAEIRNAASAGEIPDELKKKYISEETEALKKSMIIIVHSAVSAISDLM